MAEKKGGGERKGCTAGHCREENGGARDRVGKDEGEGEMSATDYQKTHGEAPPIGIQGVSLTLKEKRGGGGTALSAPISWGKKGKWASIPSGKKVSSGAKK